MEDRLLKEEIMCALDAGKRIRFHSASVDITVEHLNNPPQYIARNNLLRSIDSDSVFTLGSGNKPSIDDLINAAASGEILVEI